MSKLPSIGPEERKELLEQGRKIRKRIEERLRPLFKVGDMSFSRENLANLRCSKCSHWWSIQSPPPDIETKKWFCPWCGHQEQHLDVDRGKSLDEN